MLIIIFYSTSNIVKTEEIDDILFSPYPIGLQLKNSYIFIVNEKGMFFFNYVKNMLNDTYEFIFEQENPDYLLFSFYGCKHNDLRYKW